MKKKKTGYETLCLILLIILALLFIFPLYWIVTGSVKEKADILIKSGQSVQWLPLSPTMANYQSLMKNQVTMVLFGSAIKMPAAIRWLINSVLISLMAMLITCFTASLAGYALAKKTFWGKGFIFTLFICAMELEVGDDGVGAVLRVGEFQIGAAFLEAGDCIHIGAAGSQDGGAVRLVVRIRDLDDVHAAGGRVGRRPLVSGRRITSQLDGVVHDGNQITGLCFGFGVAGICRGAGFRLGGLTAGHGIPDPELHGGRRRHGL